MQDTEQLGRWALGVDPGHDGGAVLMLDGRLIVGAWSWRRRSRKAGKLYEVRWVQDDPAAWAILGEYPRLGDAMRAILGAAVDEPYDLVVEGLLPHFKSSKLSLISLGEATGCQVGVFTRGAARLWRPPAGEWRRRVGLGTGKAWDEARAVREATERWGLFDG